MSTFQYTSGTASATTTYLSPNKPLDLWKVAVKQKIEAKANSYRLPGNVIGWG